MTSTRSAATTFFLFVAGWCICSFKIVVVGVGDHQSSIRIDDALILLAFLVLLVRGDLIRIKPSPALKVYLGFIVISGVSAIWNSYNGRVGWAYAGFFVARLMQYIVFYYLGYLLGDSGYDLSNLLHIYVGALWIVVPLQMWGLIPTAGDFSGILSRAVGNTNGPYELAVVAGFIICYLGYGKGRPLTTVLGVGLVILSASRITFIATLWSLGKTLLRKCTPEVRTILIATSLTLVGIVTVLGLGSAAFSADSSESEGIVGRLSSATSVVTMDVLPAVYDAVPFAETSEQYMEGVFADAITVASTTEGDTSGLLRVFRWTSLIKSAVQQPDALWLGLGPSFGSAAVDGYYVRVFAETGIIGLATFAAFAAMLLLRRADSCWAFREYVFLMVVTAVFIDVFVSYKPMILLWMWHGMNQVNSAQKAHLIESR